MSSLVTGGTGLVGGAIVGELVRRGERVRALVRPTSNSADLVSRGVEIVYGDILDKPSVQRAIEGCDTVYHAAALYDFWGLDERVLTRTECEGTRNVLEAAQAIGVDKVVYTSSAVTIGERRGEIGTEKTAHRGYFLTKYERAKFEAEQIALSFVDKGLPIVIVSPAAVYGPGDRKPTGRTVLGVVNGRFPGIPAGTTSLVYIDDVAVGHVQAARQGRTGERYILCGDVVALMEWAALICKLAGTKLPPKVPSLLAGMFASSGEAVSFFTKKPPALAQENFRLVSHGFRVDGSMAAGELGVRYTSLEEGMRSTILWYWRNGLLKAEPACADCV